MTLQDIVESVAEGYYDKKRFLSYWSKEQQRPLEGFSGGDNLVPVILKELLETYDPRASDVEQVKAALEALRSVNSDLAGCIESLKILGVKRQVMQD